MKKKILYIFLFIILFTWGLSLQRKRDIKIYQTFLSSDIDGVLEDDVWASSGGNRIKVEGVMYKIKIIRRLKGKHITFSNFAKAGDYVRKKVNSDTIVLQKPSGEIYLFGFKKYE